MGTGRHKSKDCNKVSTISYEKWSSMFTRCYGSSDIKRRPTYSESIVDDSWDCFQDFGDWFEENFKPYMDSSWCLDKDILIKGNKIYSPETCCLIPHEINTLLIKADRRRGLFPIGVHKKGKKFIAQISKGAVKFSLGSFDTPEEAFDAYKIAKESWVKEVADKWKPFITPEVYSALYIYRVNKED